MASPVGKATPGLCTAMVPSASSPGTCTPGFAPEVSLPSWACPAVGAWAAPDCHHYRLDCSGLATRETATQRLSHLQDCRPCGNCQHLPLHWLCSTGLFSHALSMGPEHPCVTTIWLQQCELRSLLQHCEPRSLLGSIVASR